MDVGSLALPPEHANMPHYRQLYHGLRQAILHGQLRPGQRLPASRALAIQLGLARGTVLQAYDQLILEGYITTQRGAGTFVAPILPEDVQPAPPHLPEPESLLSGRTLSKRMLQQLEHTPNVLAPHSIVKPFQSGLAPLDAFPRTAFARIANQVLRSLPMSALGYNPGAGYLPLREALAMYLRTTRGLHCEAHQIIVTTGSQQGLHLATHVLSDVGDTIWVEDPCYGGARAAFATNGLKLAPIPVDSEGLHVIRGREQAPHARMAYVTPAHQYPLGVTMSLARRLDLLQWASNHQAWIIEDDYDGEFRYEGQPLATLQSLDRHQRVMYIGSFSKVLAPALRLGYLVVPPDLVEAFTLAKATSDRHTPLLMQAVLARFIEDGQFGRHLRRMRKLCHDRQLALLDALSVHLASWLTFHPDPAGLHLVASLNTPHDDTIVAEKAAEHNIRVGALSRYAIQTSVPPSLIFGYASFTPKEMDLAAQQLAHLFHTLDHSFTAQTPSPTYTNR